MNILLGILNLYFFSCSTDGPVMDDTPMKVTENRLYRSSSNGGQTDSGRGNSDVEVSVWHFSDCVIIRY